LYGDVPPVASKLVVKKLLTNTLLPAPMSQTPPLQVKNCVSIASGGGVPVPVPVSGAVCGLPGALSVTLSVAVRVPDVVGVKVIDMSQLLRGASVRAGQPSLTAAKSSASGPPIAALLMNSDASPQFVTVIDCGAARRADGLRAECHRGRREHDGRRRSSRAARAPTRNQSTHRHQCRLRRAGPREFSYELGPRSRRDDAMFTAQG